MWDTSRGLDSFASITQRLNLRNRKDRAPADNGLGTYESLPLKQPKGIFRHPQNCRAFSSPAKTLFCHV